jgi:mannose-6-phosphate isomerase
MNFEERPWGNYTVLISDSTYQVKKLVVYPGKRLSLQSHKFRAEHWFIVSGVGFVQIENENKEVAAGDSVNIPIGAKHRISCTSKDPLTFVEVQTGNSFDENDIIRHEDDFGRS